MPTKVLTRSSRNTASARVKKTVPKNGRLKTHASPKNSSTQSNGQDAANWQSTGIATGYLAFQDELKSLCASPKTRRRWVVFVGNKRAEIGDSKWELIQVCQAKGLTPWDYFVGYAVPDSKELDIESANWEKAE